MKKEILLILDSNSILHRAFYALPKLTNKKGEVINAVYGFLLVFFKMVKQFQPNFIFACFDFPAKTFRHKVFEEYKATRPPTPQDLISQIQKLKEILKSLNVPVLEKEGFEADDLVATICEKTGDNFEKIIVSGDSDILQIINEKTKVYLLKKGVKNTILYDENLFKEKFSGLSPSELVDFKALAGDPSDNIPGIKGIGEKTALKLIQNFKNLENLYKKIKEGEKIDKKIKNNLIEEEKRAFLNREILKLEKNLPIEISLQKWEYKKEAVIKTFEEIGFKSLIKRLSELKKNSQRKLF